MSSKFINALIILTVAALCAAAAFQYLEMESFGLPQTLKERFFPEPAPPPPASESEESSGETSTEGTSEGTKSNNPQGNDTNPDESSGMPDKGNN